MWLLNATTSEQKRGLADYFSPTTELSHNTSGYGAIFGGHTPNDDGALASDRGAIQAMNDQVKPSFDVEEDESDTPASAASLSNGQPGVNTRRAGDHAGGAAAKDSTKPGDQLTLASAVGPVNKSEAELKAEMVRREKASFDPAAGTGSLGRSEAELRAELAQKEKASFEQAAKQIRDMVASDPALADLGRQLAVDITKEGLRIQILDEDKQAMFASGSAVLNDKARALLLKVAPVLMKLPERLSITGHTDAIAVSRRRSFELGAVGRTCQRHPPPAGRGRAAGGAGARPCPAGPTATRCCPADPTGGGEPPDRHRRPARSRPPAKAEPDSRC